MLNELTSTWRCFGYGGITAAGLLDMGVGIFGRQNCDAPCGMVLGTEFNL